MCDNYIVFKSFHKYYGIPKYIKGHSTKGRNHKGKNNPNYGNSPSLKTRQLWSKQRKGNKNCVGRIYSEETLLKMAKSRFRTGLGMYRKRALNMFKYQCNKCYTTIKKLDIHHKDGNKYNNPFNGSNWELLCRKCHLIHHKKKII